LDANCRLGTAANLLSQNFDFSNPKTGSHRRQRFCKQKSDHESPRRFFVRRGLLRGASFTSSYQRGRDQRADGFDSGQPLEFRVCKIYRPYPIGGKSNGKRFLPAEHLLPLSSRQSQAKAGDEGSTRSDLSDSDLAQALKRAQQIRVRRVARPANADGRKVRRESWSA
jgi:hypothetical protein